MIPPKPQLSALAVNVAVPPELQWTDERRGEEFTLTTLNVRLLPDGSLATKAYGRPTVSGRAAYTSFRVPDDGRLQALIASAAQAAADAWGAAASRVHEEAGRR